MNKPGLVTVSVLGTLVALAGIVLLVIFTGVYDVAADGGHAGLTRWALNTLQESSVSARAAYVEGSPPTDSTSLQHGLEHYREMCVTCHGAPGVQRGEVGRGMTPLPPNLRNQAGEWTDAELFWITKHGIKLAGMPAFGATHSDEEIWAITAFVRGLPEMNADDYAEAVRSLEASPSRPGHTHGVDSDAGHAHDEGTGEERKP